MRWPVWRACPLTFAAGEVVKPSAVVQLDLEGETSWVFLTEVGAGYALVVPSPGGTPPVGARVRTVTTQSPLGRALAGARQGDWVTVRVGADERVYESEDRRLRREAAIDTN